MLSGDIVPRPHRIAGTQAARSVDLDGTAAAFVCATNPKRQNSRQWLNPLRAVSLLYRLPKHRLKVQAEEDEKESRYDQCRICGEARKSDWMPMTAANSLPSGYSGEDFEIFNQLMVLRWFQDATVPTVTRSDKAAFNRFLKVLSDAPPKSTAMQAARILKKTLGGFSEWAFHLEALAFAGVLKTARQPGNLQEWADFCNRRKSSPEVPTPMCHWRRSMGFDTDVFSSLFPDTKLPTRLRAPAA